MAQNRTVLVVEDDPQVRDLEVLVFRDLECTPCVARDALEAMALVRALAGQVVLVLADLDIGPFDGLELARRLEVDVPHLGVILTCCCPEDVRDLLPPNVRGVLVKPFGLPTMAQMVREALPTVGGGG